MKKYMVRETGQIVELECELEEVTLDRIGPAEDEWSPEGASPAKELGYSLGDHFTGADGDIKDGHFFGYHNLSIHTYVLIEDDGSESPLFTNLDTDCGPLYISLYKLKKIGVSA